MPIYADIRISRLMPISALCRKVPEIACRAPEPSSKDRHNSRTARERNSAGDRLARHCGSQAGTSTGAGSSSAAGTRSPSIASAASALKRQPKVRCCLDRSGSRLVLLPTGRRVSGGGTEQRREGQRTRQRREGQRTQPNRRRGDPLGSHAACLLACRRAGR